MTSSTPFTFAGIQRCCAMLLVLLCATACTLSTAGTSLGNGCDQPPPAGLPVDGLYVLPDDGRMPIIEEIDAARCSIDVTIYLISDDEVIDALARAQARGVIVRVLLEETPFGGFGQVDTADVLRSLGIQVKPGRDSFRFTHAKYLVLDRAVGIVTNQNLTFSSFESNREFGVITTDRTVVDSLAAVFEADWTRSDPPGIADRLIVSPIDARESLISLLRDAGTSILLYAEVVRDDAIVAELVHAVARGVDVRLIVNPPDDDLDNAVMTTLADGGVEIRVVEHLYIHAKAMLVDNALAVIGSHNPTSTSIDENREVSLIVRDAVAVERVRATFDHDWRLGSAWFPAQFPVGKMNQNQPRLPLALDMPMVYGYCVRTVPKGLSQIS